LTVLPVTHSQLSDTRLNHDFFIAGVESPLTCQKLGNQRRNLRVL